MENQSWLHAILPDALHLEIENPHLKNDSLMEYLTYYNFEITQFDTYRAGFVNRESHAIFLQIFQNNQSDKTILFVHGYLDHSAGSSKTINFLLREGYSVAVLDLPGHGFSQGEAGYISSFDEYILAVQAAYLEIFRFAPGKQISALGHSTGAAVLFHAAAEGNCRFEELILVAPLYLPYQWKKTRGFLKVAGKLSPHQKRRFKKNSADRMYRQFIKQDPLQVKWLRTDWMYALETWQKHIYQCPVYTGHTYILQGTRDTTVEWKENLKFFENKCTNIQIAMFPRARHQLLNERPSVRKEAERLIKQNLLQNM